MPTTIKITSFEPPINGGEIYSGGAENADGERWKWLHSPGRGSCSCFREEPVSGVWYREKAPAALVCAVLDAFRAAAH